MRVAIPPTTAAGIQGPYTRIYQSTKKANVKIQILDAGVTVYFSTNASDLSSLDALGNPKAGLLLTQGVYDFLAFIGAMYLACNQQTSVEVQAWTL